MTAIIYNAVIIRSGFSSVKGMEMLRMLRLAVVVTVLLGFDSIVTGETLYVPGEYPTIQAAIDAAMHGDVVEIADGTYTGTGNKNLDFGGKAITVRSASGDPNTCIIDCEHNGRGFYFQSGEDPNSIVSGLTIYMGYPLNSRPNNLGAGVFCFLSSPTFEDCVIRGCSANGDGGGLYCYRSNPVLRNCMIIANKSNGWGGGVFCFQCRPTFSSCTLAWNSSDQDGGGAYCVQGSNPKFDHCMISANVAGGSGGGVSCRISSFAGFSNCLINDNEAFNGGGGVHCSESSSRVINCTIAGNRANQGGGFYFDGQYPYPRLTNCVVWANEAEAIYVNSGYPSVTFSNIQDGIGESWFGEGCIDVDPQFIDPDGPDDRGVYWRDNNYRLADSSPCIDAGTTSISEVPDDDLDHHPRPFDGDGDAIAIVDMGAYEFGSLLGDINSDGFVDYQDFSALEACITGPTINAPAGCEQVDLDGDGDVDLIDVAIMYYPTAS